MSGLLSSSPIARGSISSSVEIPVGFNSCPGSASQPQQQLPQVTISHDVEGRQIEYPNPGLDSGLFRDSRIFRSHSLTPMGSISKFSVPDCDPKKLRSNSVTLGSGEHQHKQRYPDVGVEGPEFKGKYVNSCTHYVRSYYSKDYEEHIFFPPFFMTHPLSGENTHY